MTDSTNVLAVSRRVAASLAVALALVAPSLAQSVAPSAPSPEEHLGRTVGADFELADWTEVRTYFEALAEASPHVRTETIGRTTEGRDFILATISSAANLERLDELKGYAKTLADPRAVSHDDIRTAIDQGRVFLFISCAMHATETAAPQFAMEFAWNLATSNEEPWASAREEIVVVLAPSLNPDGQDHVVEWYRTTVGTPYEASSLLRLYQYYAGHDNNRDWFMLTQAETRLVTEQLYKVWRPQVYWDVHQQGRGGERMFVPPFRNPLNPNLDPGIISAIGTLGSRALHDMTREGFSGVSSGVSYDMWWNGGNRNVPVRHNIVGLLTEAASVRLASPVFLVPNELRPPEGSQYVPANNFPDPWPGGWWRIRNIIDYELAFGRSLLGSLAREREHWLRNAYEAAQRSIQTGTEATPRVWLIPSDNPDYAAVERLVEALMLAGVEIHVVDGPFPADGRMWPAGTIVIRRDQPYGAHVKDLFEVQRYPKGAPPYDIAGWTLPMLMGVRRVEIHGTFEIPTRLVPNLELAMAGFRGPALERSSEDGRSWRAAFERLRKSEPISLVIEGESGGALIDGADGGLVVERMPRIGIYAPWRGSMDEGWMRWLFDHFQLPFVTVRNEMLRAGDLDAFLDVLVLPGPGRRDLEQGRWPGSVPDEYVGGLDPEGAVAIEEFVRGGGTLVAVQRSASWVVDLLQLPLVDVTSGTGFSCPGSVLRAVPEVRPRTAGLPHNVPIFFSRALGWRSMTAPERKAADIDSGVAEPHVLLRYAPTRLLLSGYIEEPETLAGHAAWVRAKHGEGAVHLFAFRPQYRGWSQASFQLLFRALLFD